MAATGAAPRVRPAPPRRPSVLIDGQDLYAYFAKISVMAVSASLNSVARSSSDPMMRLPSVSSGPSGATRISPQAGMGMSESDRVFACSKYGARYGVDWSSWTVVSADSEDVDWLTWRLRCGSVVSHDRNATASSMASEFWNTDH